MNQQIKQRIEQINNGQVPEGYKKTEFGIFPSDWVTDKKLKDIGSFDKGRGLPGDKMCDSGVPCVGYGDIYMKYNNFHFEKAENFVDEETASESLPIKKGTLLFTGTGETAEEIGKCVCYNGDETIYAGGDIITFKTNDVNPLFLAYQQYQSYSLAKKASFGQGHSVVHIHADNLEKLNVAYPKSIAEQEKIAEILMKWDKVIELQEKYVEKLIIRKDKTIQELIKAQKNWIKTTLSTVLIEKSERTKINNQHQVLSSTKIGLVAQSDYFDKQVASEDNTGYKIVKKGEIVLSPQNLWLGNINYNDNFDIGIVSPSYKIFEINNSFDKVFISTLMKSPKMLHQYVLSSEQGASVVRRNLNMDSFYDIQICVPTLEKQRRISTIISVSQKLIEFENEKLDKMKQQRKALQQYLLNGIVRVEV